jgi:polar amino acid transport system substrate-binding protein
MAQASQVRHTLTAAFRIVLVTSTLLAGGWFAQATAAQGGSASEDVLADIGGDGVLTNCVDPAFPPMEYMKDANAKAPIGFDIDLTNEIASRLGVEAEFVPLEFTGLLPGLQSGRCDIVASGIYATPERLETFGAQPYYDSAVVLVTRADNDDISSPEDLSGKTVAVQSGTNNLATIEALDAQLRADGKDGITIQTYPKQVDADQQLIVQRADATITQDTEVAFRETEQPGQFKIAYTYPDAQTFAIFYNPDDTALGGALEEIVEGMREDGTLAEIATTWNLPEAGVEFTREFGTQASPVASPAATPAS